MRLSQKILDFNVEAGSFINYLNVPENATRLGVSNEQVAKGAALMEEWAPKYLAYCSPDTYGPITILGINLAYDKFHEFVQKMQKQIKNNESVVLTEDDYVKLFLHRDKEKRAHVPRPTFAPQNSLQNQSHLKVQIFAFNPNPPFQKEVALPADVSKIGRMIAITLADAATPEINLYHNIEMIGSTVFELCFVPENVGSRVWVITYYINSTGEQGPYSEPISFLVN